ncbi:hypothetical protein PS1_038151 [Malus domestica]
MKAIEKTAHNGNSLASLAGRLGFSSFRCHWHISRQKPDYTSKIPIPLGAVLRAEEVSLEKSLLEHNLNVESDPIRNYPFVAKEGDDEKDPRTYPGHREVLMYLKDFAIEFEISEIVRLETEMVVVDALEGGNWEVKSKSKRDVEDEIYDVVVMCNGHYTEPRLPQILGI